MAHFLLDINLDIGVGPAIIQSDKEVTTLAIEFSSLLGASQLLSTGLRPQSQGIVERFHLDIRRGLSLLAEAYIHADPRKWPDYVRWLESKLRHKVKATGDTSYSRVHGRSRLSPLSSFVFVVSSIKHDPSLRVRLSRSVRYFSALLGWS